MNYDYEKIPELLKGIPIIGRNIDDLASVDFKSLTEHFTRLSEKQRESLEFLERFYRNKFEELNSNLDKISAMEIKNGKVVIEPGTPFHLCVPRLHVLENISNGGVLASEWFGALESEGEGRFCSFLNTTVDESIVDENDNFLIKNIRRSLGKDGLDTCVLYFDQNNEVMQELLNMDFFEYAKLRQEDPSAIEKKYSKEVIDLYENLIYPLSIGGKDHHKKGTEKYDTYYWRAIPGGVPPQLINGICLNTKPTDGKVNPEVLKKMGYSFELLENLDKLSELFPNATIFDEEKNVLVYPNQTLGSTRGL